MTKEEKRSLLKSISEYSKYSEQLYEKHNIVDLAKELAEMCKNVERLTLTEIEDKFDTLTVKRNMKEMIGLLRRRRKLRK